MFHQYKHLKNHYLSEVTKQSESMQYNQYFK